MTFDDARQAARGALMLLVAALAVGVPGTAHAQGYISPGLGVSFGSPSAQGRANFIGDIGWLSRDPIGVELDGTYAPSFFKNPDSLTENTVATVMGNVIFAGGGRERGRFGRRRGSAGARPYFTVGMGLMRERVETVDGATSVSNHHLGVNAGVGIMAISRQQFGVRLDVRYFRDLVGTDNGGTTGIDFGSFHFWRGGIAAIFAF